MKTRDGVALFTLGSPGPRTEQVTKREVSSEETVDRKPLEWNIVWWDWFTLCELLLKAEVFPVDICRGWTIDLKASYSNFGYHAWEVTALWPADGVGGEFPTPSHGARWYCQMIFWQREGQYASNNYRARSENESWFLHRAFKAFCDLFPLMNVYQTATVLVCCITKHPKMPWLKTIII